MKLLVDAHCFDYRTSEGINTHIKGLYRELIKIATDIDFYFVARDIETLKSIFGKAPNIYYVALTSKNKIYRLLFEFPAIIRKYQIDAAHYQYTSPLIKNCKNIITLHDILFVDYPQYFPFSYRLMKGILFRISAKRADLLLTVSEYSRTQISLHYHIPLKDIYVTPNAVSEDFWSIDKETARQYIKGKGLDKYLLYVSRLEPRKNQLALLKAFCELKLYKKGYDLVFIGRRTLPVPAFEEYYQGLSESVRSKIHIINQVSYDDLKLWYKAASLFVYPAMAEGFGIPPIEAGAAMIPCVCSNKTAMGDFTFFGKNLIDTSDSRCLNEAILYNLSCEIDCREISCKIHDKYNWRAIAMKFHQLLSALNH